MCVRVSGLDPTFPFLPPVPTSHSRAPRSKSVFLATVKSGTTQQRLPNITMTKLMTFDPAPVGTTSPDMERENQKIDYSEFFKK